MERQKDHIAFVKYQGTGNDFVMIDDRAGRFDPGDSDLIARLCHRRFGVGADGLILLRKHTEADFEMLYYNADGRVASLCGNGSRCVVRFAHDLGIISKKTRFMTVEGILTATIEDELVSVRMPDVIVPDHGDGPDYFLDTGSPHHVCMVGEGLKDMDVVGRGRQIRHSERYGRDGVNVNFVEEQDGILFVRTYERGVEEETYSCGTGVTASALVYGIRGVVSPVRIKTPGGALEVSFRREGGGRFTDIMLTGPAMRVFDGTYPL